MTEQDWLAERFEQHRPRLRAVSYRMLGSLSEADDAVQEAWLRLSRADTSQVDDLGAWLTTVVARVCLNVLRSRAARREEPIRPHMPDPVVSAVDAVDPEDEALIADSVGLALLIVLDTLAPAERLAVVLHDAFDVPFEQIAAIIDRSEPATRQLASRARRRLRATPTPEATIAEQWELVDAFLAAARDGLGQRRTGRGHVRRRTALRGARIHGRRRQDRRDEHPGRPGPCPEAGPGRPGTLKDSGPRARAGRHRRDRSDDATAVCGR